MKLTCAIKHGKQPFISIQRSLAAWRLLRIRGLWEIIRTHEGYFIPETDETIRTPRFTKNQP